MTHTSTSRRRLSALAATALVASLLATGALPAAAAPAIVPDTATLSTPENGAATFNVSLSEAPTADVTVAVTSSDTGIVTVGPGSLTFTAGDYTIGQQITVTGVDNTVTDGDAPATIQLEATSTDGAYQGLTASVDVTRVDDEVPGITVDPVSGLVTDEDGTTASFTVALNEQPNAASVTVTVTSDKPAEATTDRTELSFTTGDWNEVQTVVVTGIDDDIIDGSVGFTITITASDTGGYSTSVTEQVTGTNADNDTASLIVTAPDGGLATDESGTTDSFSVRLSSKPTAAVEITFTSSDDTEATASPLTIEPANWNTPQDVTVTGVDDGEVDGDIAYTISGAAVSTDTDYDGLTITDVAGTNADNDVTAPPPSEDPDTEEGENAFNDVGTLDAETIEAINTLVALEITQGTSASTFSPTLVVSRWQMALFLSRQLVVHGVSLPSAPDTDFTDLDGLDAETREAIAQLAALDVTTGTGSGTYSPDAGVTRWQMALFMTRVLDAAGVDLPTTLGGDFDDIADLSPEAQLAIRQLAALGVVFGVGDGAFDPTAEIPRWQMALFIVRTLEAAGVSTS